MFLRKSLFVPGPTNLPDVIRKAIDVPMEDHRAPDLPEFILPLLNDVKKVNLFSRIIKSINYLIWGDV